MNDDMNPKSLQIEANAEQWLGHDENWRQWEFELTSDVREVRAHVMTYAVTLGICATLYWRVYQERRAQKRLTRRQAR